MDAFYASIEQRDNPEYRGKPVIVGATSARGVVAAASYEARRFGVRSAMPGFRAKELCPEGIYLPSNIRKYSEVSDEVHEVFRDFTSEIEPISLDEAFLDITGSVRLFGGPIELGAQLKRAVRQRVDLAVSVGIGPSKLVAKLACTHSKPDGILLVPPETISWFMSPMPVRRLWGVGPVMEQKLRGLGIDTIGQLARIDTEILRREVGTFAEDLQRRASGLDDRHVESHLAAKSYGEENTFHDDVTDRETVTAALTSHSEAVARRLRRDGLRGRTVTVKIKLARARGRRIARGRNDGDEPRYPLLTRSKTLLGSTSDGTRIRDVAIALWDAAAVGEAVRLLGVSVSSIDRGEGEQLELFSEPRGDKLGPALDAITERFGRGMISRAVVDPEKVTHSHQRKRGE